jgi:hypothetical protein
MGDHDKDVGILALRHQITVLQFPAILTVQRRHSDRDQSRSLRDGGRVAAATGQLVAVPWRPGGPVPLLGVTELAGPDSSRPIEHCWATVVTDPPPARRARPPTS